VKERKDNNRLGLKGAYDAVGLKLSAPAPPAPSHPSTAVWSGSLPEFSSPRSHDHGAVVSSGWLRNEAFMLRKTIEDNWRAFSPEKQTNTW